MSSRAGDEDLPLADTPYAFAVVLGIMAAIAGSMLVIFRSRRWI